MTRRLARSVAGLGLLAACTSPSHSASSLLLDTAGAGYHLDGASGPLTKEALSSATALPHDEMASYLASVTFRRAAERVWTSPADGFVTDVVVEVGGAAEAAELVSVANRVLPGPATRGFAVGDTGRGFVQTSDVHGQTMFCVMAFLQAGVRAFVLTRCTPYPQDTTTVTGLARDQLRRIG
jgi:hypothetical protein